MPSILNATTTNGLVTSADNSGSLQLQTNNGTTAVTIDTSQNVGIGSTPVNSRRLTVTTASQADLSIVAASNNYAQLLFGYSGADNKGIISYYNSDNSMQFYTNSTERMRITSGGQLLVGATTNQVFSGVTADHAFIGPTGNSRWIAGFRNSGNSTPWGIVVGYSGASPNNTSNDFIWCEDTIAQRAAIRSNGGVANYSGNNVNLSDEREKTNIELSGSYLDKICAIPVKTFNYIDQNREEDDGLTLGVIAQDVQAIAPELVTEDNWGTETEPKMRLSIYQTDLQYALMKCIQELKAELDATKAEVQALKGVA